MSLSRRHLSLLLGGLLVSEIGTGATDVVVAWLVLSHTGSAALTGLVWASSSLAMLIGGPLGGYVADRLPRRHAMIAADGARVVLVGGLGIALLTGWFSLPLILAIVFCNAFLTLLFEGALQALIPALAGEQLEQFNGRVQAVRMLGNMLGPIMGGVLLAATAYPGAALVIDAATYLACLGAVVAIHVEEPRRALSMGRSALFAGLATLGSVPALRRLTIFAVALAFVFPLIALSLPLIARSTDTGGLGYGVLSTLFLIGMAVGGLAGAWLSERLGGDRVIVYGLVGEAVGTIALALSHTSYPLAVAGAFWLGLAVGPIEVVFMSGFQRAAPPELLGRAMTQLISLNAIVRAPAYAVGGVLFGLAGIAPMLLACAVAELIGAVVYAATASRTAPTLASSPARS